MRIIFLGTPDFVVPALEALARDGRYTLVGVVTQPDRPAGRSRAPQPSPVKQAAQRLGLAVMQPETLRDPAAVEQITALRPDVGVIAAYGEILRKHVLAIPPLGYLNIHPSLLPRYRGPSPVAGAILAGDDEAGVTIMRLEARMDSGPILVQQRVPLPPDARAKTMTERLFEQGAALLVEALARYAAGELEPVPQDDSQATYTSLLQKSDGAIDWSAPAVVVERMTRAYDPWPSAWTTWRAQQLKIIAARAHVDWHGDARPSTILAHQEGVWVATGAGALELLTVQSAGGRALAAADWRRGLHDIEGAQLGS